MIKIVGNLSNFLKSQSPYPKVWIHDYLYKAPLETIRSSSYYFQIYKKDLKKEEKKIVPAKKELEVVKLQPLSPTQKMAKLQAIKSPKLSYVRSSSYYFNLYKLDLEHQQKYGDIHVTVDYIVGGKIIKPTMKKSRKDVILKNVVQHGALICEYCKNTLSVDKVTFDHFHPKCQGGQDNKGENLKVACYSCNQFKAGFNPKTQPQVYNLFLDLVKEKKYSHLEFILNSSGDDFIYLLSNRKHHLKDDDLLQLMQLTFKVYSKEKLKKLLLSDKRFKETIDRTKQIILNRQLKKILV